MKLADWNKCNRAGMSSEFYYYHIDPETLTITDTTPDDEITSPFKKISGRIKFNPVVLVKGTKEKAESVHSSTDQKKLLKYLLTKFGFYETPKKILICSERTDKIPMIIASCMAQHLIIGAGDDARPVFINSYFKSDDKRPKLTFDSHNHLTVFGLSSTSTDYKFQEVRDIISSVTWPCSVVLVAGGVSNPAEFYQKKLNLAMDAVISISDSIQI